jgi:hypothetical protein
VSNLLVKHGVRRRADLLFCALRNGPTRRTSQGDDHSPHDSVSGVSAA